MDLDKEFVRSVLKEGEPAYKAAVERGITAEALLDEGKQAWELLVKHRKEYGTLPSKELLLSSLVDAQGNPVDLSAGLMEPNAVLLDKLLERKTLNLLAGETKRLVEKITKRDAKEAVEVFGEIHRKLQKEQITVSKIETLFSLGKDVISYYEMVKSGAQGIPTPWPTMTRQTMGWWPEDLILIIGRLGQGKTWSLLLISHAAWMPGKRVLICTTEMSREALAQRFLCMHLRIPYSQYRSGRLGAFIESKLRDGVSALMGEQGIDVVGNDFDYSIDSLDAAVEENKPDLLVVDGAYLIKNTGKDRHERVSNTFDDFKRIGKRRKISVATSTQFNRQAKSGQEESLTADNIGITDVAGWNATAAFGLLQTPEMFEKRIMGLKPLKIREGKPEAFQVQWDLDQMVFGEIADPNKPDDPSPFPPPASDDLSDDMPDIPF